MGRWKKGRAILRTFIGSIKWGGLYIHCSRSNRWIPRGSCFGGPFTEFLWRNLCLARSRSRRQSIRLNVTCHRVLMVFPFLFQKMWGFLKNDIMFWWAIFTRRDYWRGLINMFMTSLVSLKAQFFLESIVPAFSCLLYVRSSPRYYCQDSRGSQGIFHYEMLSVRGRQTLEICPSIHKINSKSQDNGYGVVVKVYVKITYHHICGTSLSLLRAPWVWWQAKGWCMRMRIANPMC